MRVNAVNIVMKSNENAIEFVTFVNEQSQPFV